MLKQHLLNTHTHTYIGIIASVFLLFITYLLCIPTLIHSLNLTYSIGGQISFDVFPNGWDKTYALQVVIVYPAWHSGFIVPSPTCLHFNRVYAATTTYRVLIVPLLVRLTLTHFKSIYVLNTHHPPVSVHRRKWIWWNSFLRVTLNVLSRCHPTIRCNTFHLPYLRCNVSAAFVDNTIWLICVYKPSCGISHTLWRDKTFKVSWISR